MYVCMHLCLFWMLSPFHVQSIQDMLSMSVSRSVYGFLDFAIFINSGQKLIPHHVSSQGFHCFLFSAALWKSDVLWRCFRTERLFAVHFLLSMMQPPSRSTPLQHACVFHPSLVQQHSPCCRLYNQVLYLNIQAMGIKTKPSKPSRALLLLALSCCCHTLSFPLLLLCPSTKSCAPL